MFRYDDNVVYYMDPNDPRAELLRRLLQGDASVPGGFAGTPGRVPGITPSPVKTSDKYREELRNQKTAAEDELKDAGNADEKMLPYYLNAYKKGLMPEDELRERLKAMGRSELKGKSGKSDIDFIIDLSKQQPNDFSASQLVNGMKKGLIDDAAVKERLKEAGYSTNPGTGNTKGDSALDVMFNMLKSDSVQKDKELNTSVMTQALKSGKMTEQDVMGRLVESGYAAKDAEILLGVMKSESKNKPLSMSALSDAYKRGDISEGDLRTRLGKDYELAPADVELTMRSIEEDQKPSLGLLGNMFEGGQIGDNEVLGRLMSEQNYSERDARNILANMQQEKAKKSADELERAAAKAQSAADRAERQREKAENEKERAKNKEEQRIEENKRAPRVISDGVDGFLENFHKDLTTTLSDASLSPDVKSWAMHNEDIILNQSVGNGRKGGVLSGATINTLYEGMRGSARKQGETHDTQINAQQIGG